MQPRHLVSRRTVLGVAILAAAGCHGHSASQGGPTTSPISSPPPDAEALATARHAEAILLATFDARIRTAAEPEQPQLEVERAIHATHLKALGGHPAGAHHGSTHGSLKPALLASARQLRSLSLAATSGGNAALLASIAASHEARAQ